MFFCWYLGEPSFFSPRDTAFLLFYSAGIPLEIFIIYFLKLGLHRYLQWFFFASFPLSQYLPTTVCLSLPFLVYLAIPFSRFKQLQVS